ncbi:hypothetical protein CPC197_0501B, partial [Chlamydia psittaci C1/97]
SFCRVL